MPTYLAGYLSALCLAFAPAVHAWGALGHQTVAALAEDMLTPKAKAEVDALLGSAGGPGALARIATWADDVRIRRPETGPWHYVTIQIGEPRYDAAKADTPNVVGALEHALKILRDGAAAGDARAEALKWTVHLVGDLHQPLHVGEDHDKGGNLVKVKVGRRGYNLHQVWDFVLLERLQLPPDSLRAQLERDIAADPAFIPRNAKGTVEDWVDETHARSRACYLVNGKPLRKGIAQSLDRDYVRPNTLAILTQLKLAGVRLAYVLNGALDPGEPALPRAPALPAGYRAGSAGGEAYFAHAETLPQSPENKPAIYAWSVHSKVYHYAGCADVAKIKPKNLRTGDVPPPFLSLHAGCPAR